MLVDIWEVHRWPNLLNRHGSIISMAFDTSQRVLRQGLQGAG